MPTGAEVVWLASSQAGDPYIYGAEASIGNPNPRAFDCSELVEWVCGRLGVRPTVPDGARTQRDHCSRNKTLISVNSAINTQGALLFRIGRTWSQDHVAISMGNGKTIEARGRAYGTNVFSAHNRGWTHGGLIPGVNYRGNVPVPPPATKDWAAIRKAGAAILNETIRKLPDVGVGSPGLYVVTVQKALNYVSGRGLAEDGVYGPATQDAVADFEQFMGGPRTGVFGAYARFMMVKTLERIEMGLAQ